jgi:valyl-tRNA synthetase
LAQVVTNVTRLTSEYRLGDAIMELYKFIWDDFCSWYLEMVKPADGKMAPQTLSRTVAAYEQMMVLLHPFMPFITEAVWHGLKERAHGDDCCVAQWPQAQPFDAVFIDNVELAKEAIVKVRETRATKGIKARDPLRLMVAPGSKGEALLQNAGLKATVEKMAFLESITLAEEDLSNTVSFLVGNDPCYLEIKLEIDVEVEIERVKAELEHARGFVAVTDKKLSNERFVQNAAPEIVARERQKLADGQARIKALEETLARLGLQ